MLLIPTFKLKHLDGSLLSFPFLLPTDYLLGKFCSLDTGWTLELVIHKEKFASGRRDPLHLLRTQPWYRIKYKAAKSIWTWHWKSLREWKPTNSSKIPNDKPFWIISSIHKGKLIIGIAWKGPSCFILCYHILFMLTQLNRWKQARIAAVARQGVYFEISDCCGLK